MEISLIKDANLLENQNYLCADEMVIVTVCFRGKSLIKFLNEVPRWVGLWKFLRLVIAK